MASVVPTRAPDRAAIPVASEERVLWLAPQAGVDSALAELLQTNQYSIVSSRTLADALQQIAGDAAPDAVVLDTRSASEPWTDWVEKFQRTDSQMPVLLIAASNLSSSASLALRQGAYDLVAEPFTAEQILACIRRAVECRRLRAQNDLYQHHLERIISARTEMLRRTMQHLERSYDVTLEALGDALDLKDAETQGHSKRVTAYTLALGRALGLNEQQLRIVGRGAFLHDIGKMAIPDAILRKPGRLTAEERAVMCTHSELGYQMVRKIPFLQESAEIVYSHQECYDGSGYPRGLRGEQIHIGARIFALADTFDAITSNRPYRKANTLIAARQEVLRCAGTQFDPAIVDVFLATPDSIWQNLREGIMREGSAFSPFGYTFGDGS